MCDLKPVVMNNVFYITSPANAEKLQKKVYRELFGEPPTPSIAIPAGYVTDGINYYLNPGNLKVLDVGAGGGTGFGGGLGGGIPGVRAAQPVPAPQPVPSIEKPKNPEKK